MNPELKKLQPYPFEKLAKLKAAVTAPTDLVHIPLSIGEPKHTAPGFVADELVNQLHTLANYPITKGLPELRISLANWLTRRFRLELDSLDPEQHVIPVNGTREALFAFAQCVVERRDDALVLMPNPFYQIYEGAAYLSGAEPYFINCMADNAYRPDFDSIPDEIWDRCQLIYLCSPSNPTGTIIDQTTLQRLIRLADKHDFIIAADECYSEIYPDETQPPVGLLQAATEMGRTDFKRCIVFHSLSKRSNLPGMRSGFVAGDAEILKKFLLYRTYHGSAMAPYHQLASIKAWDDEAHVLDNRNLYREKFKAVIEILSEVIEIKQPEAGFYLWLKTPIDDETFAQGLFEQQHITVLPGSYLSREAHGSNPGSHHVRAALVAPLEDCIEAAYRIKTYIESI